jgi:mannose-1-phosphate guanylyltransferase
MNGAARTWAVVLAAGEGTRLASLTRDAAGKAVPKQFCSLNGGRSLVDEAIQRARQVVSLERTCVIVARQHARHWRKTLRALPAGNLIVQPQNRGTANGVLLSVLSILERDPLARIMFLPADHFVLDESALERSLRELTTSLAHNPDGITLIGIAPDEPDSELGYIVPGRTLAGGLRTVARFVEKPAPSLANELFAKKALWNSFIFGATGPALLALLQLQMGTAVDEMTTALARQGHQRDSAALAELYDRLPTVDFARAVVQQFPFKLRVITAPACGWTDLGTPRRVADTLRRLSGQVPTRAPCRGDVHPMSTPAVINLAAQHARLALVG